MPAAVSLPRLEIRTQFDTSDFVESGETLQDWLDGAGRVVACGGRTGDGWWIRWTGLATFAFGTQGPVKAYPVRPDLDEEIRDAFARGITPIVLLARGCDGLHASGVVGPSGVLGFCGLSETGKSTLAFTLAAAGFPHFADDALMYRVVGGRPLAFPIPFPVRVDSATRQSISMRSFPRDVTVEAPEGIPLKRIYLLRRDAALDPAKPVFQRVPPAVSFTTLLTHARPFEMGSAARQREFLENLLTTARMVDVWECRFAPDLDALPSFASAVRAHASEQ